MPDTRRRFRTASPRGLGEGTRWLIHSNRTDSHSVELERQLSALSAMYPETIVFAIARQP